MRSLKILFAFTQREAQSMEKYVHDISRFPRLSVAEEVLVVQRIKAGDQRAVQELVNANLSFVVSVAKQYQYKWVGLGDLVNEGNMGLIKAAKRFDETRGFKFISYAVWDIRQSIQHFLIQHSRIIRLPVDVQHNVHQVRKMRAALEQDFEREPTSEEMAEVMGLTIKKIRATLKDGQDLVSLSASCNVADPDSRTLLEIMESDERPPDDALISQSLSCDIGSALLHLSQRERNIINAFFGLGGAEMLPLERIAEHCGITYERARQVKDGALEKLQRLGKKSLLKKLCV